MGSTSEGRRETATLGGGCFWCLDGVYRDLKGVTEVVSGYAGGHVPDVLRVFFTIHDPTTKDRQGADVGPQYRSVIFYHSEEQKRTAEAVMAEVRDARVWNGPLVTELAPAPEFYPAEPEHQDYFARNPWSGYCRAVVAPKVQKFRKTFADRVKRPAA